MFWKRDHKVIAMECFDADSGEALYRARMPIERLPETFELETTMHIRDRDYTVIRAEPKTAADFRRSGKLKLMMREAKKIVLADAKDVLYSLPTITTEWPPIAPGTSQAGKELVRLHEDDWRQVEFVSAAMAEAVNAEIAGIRRIYEQCREASGFREIHVRDGLPRPLVDPLPTLINLESRFSRATRLDGIGVMGAEGLVTLGFALRLLSGLELYGTAAPDGGIDVLCLSYARPNNASAGDVAALGAFANENHLYLVDWCRCAVIDPDDAAFKQYFEQTS